MKIFLSGEIYNLQIYKAPLGCFRSVCNFLRASCGTLILAIVEFINLKGEKSQKFPKVSSHDYVTRSSWLNCALRGDEPVYWVSIGQQWFVHGGTGSVKEGAGSSRNAVYVLCVYLS